MLERGRVSHRNAWQFLNPGPLGQAGHDATGTSMQ